VHGVPLPLVGERVGSLSQVARLESVTVDEGPARGTRRMLLSTGGGLELELLPDRCLDIGQATFKSIPLAWISSVGPTSPHSYEASGTEWLRSFGGGLLATCGLDTFGPPSEVDGKFYPMHGRVGAIPATVTRHEVGEDVIVIEGTIRQTTVFGENLVLRRRYEAPLGSATLTITDTVTNESSSRAGHMMLYHFNFGWPLLHESATLHVSSDRQTPRDGDAEQGLHTWSDLEPPQSGFREQVFQHAFSSPRALASIDNASAGIRVELSTQTESLPSLFQWKMADTGHYVMGLEPANTGHVFGRRSAQESGALPYLDAGDSVSYSVTLSAMESQQ